MDGKGKQGVVMGGRFVKKEKNSLVQKGCEQMEQQKVKSSKSDDDGDDCENHKKKRLVLNSSEDGGGTDAGGKGKGGGEGMRCCQVEKCEADLSNAKPYHRRHKVCECHAKAQFVVVAGFKQRFCQQCSRFHELSEFDETRRSCGRSLAGHNERRKKNAQEPRTQGLVRKGLCTKFNDILRDPRHGYQHIQIR